jgi:hypothetical protein
LPGRLTLADLDGLAADTGRLPVIGLVPNLQAKFEHRRDQDDWEHIAPGESAGGNRQDGLEGGRNRNDL